MGAGWLGLVLVVLAVVAIAVYISSSEESRKRLEVAHQRYQGSLAELKQKPTDPDLKVQALQFGREYSRLTREGGKETLFDEAALSNDINAACAAATRAVEVPTSQPATVEARLEELSTLKTRGLISEVEYAESRKRILEGL